MKVENISKREFVSALKQSASIALLFVGWVKPEKVFDEKMVERYQSATPVDTRKLVRATATLLAFECEDGKMSYAKYDYYPSKHYYHYRIDGNIYVRHENYRNYNNFIIYRV